MNVLLSFILALLPNLPIQQLDRTLNLVELGVSTAVPTIAQVNGSEQLCSNVVDMATTIKEAEDRIEQERLEQERLEQERLAQEAQKPMYLIQLLIQHLMLTIHLTIHILNQVTKHLL